MKQLTPRMLNHLAYVTHDVAATADFYTRILGMEPRGGLEKSPLRDAEGVNCFAARKRYTPLRLEGHHVVGKTGPHLMQHIQK